MEKIHHILHDTSEVCTAFINDLSTKFLYKCGATFSLFLLQFSFSGVEYIVIFAIFCLIIADLVTKLIAEYKNKNEITSRKIAKTIIKLVAYSFMIASGSFIEVS